MSITNMKHKPINGWTKERILEVIKARPFEERAMIGSYCTYLASNGNKCAVGLFIPDGHLGQHSKYSVDTLLNNFPDLVQVMPLTLYPLMLLQNVHDLAVINAKTAMLDWVEKECRGLML